MMVRALYIPDWRHEEYLKSLQPKLPRDLFYYIDLPPRLLKRFADNLILFFGCLGDGLYHFLAGKRINR